MRLAVRRPSPTGRPESTRAACRLPATASYFGEVGVLCASGSPIRAHDRNLPVCRAPGLLKAVECILYLSIPIARLEAPRIEARSTNYRKESERGVSLARLAGG